MSEPGDYDYEGVRRIVYGDDGSDYCGATFVPVCPKCGRFVKPDALMHFADETIAPGPNGTCKKCGRIEMLFEGFL